jgi:membrane-associated phospholipid phosphatase
MAQSIFESGKFGGSDFGIFLGIFAFIYWVSIKRRSGIKDELKKLKLKFIFLSVILAPLLSVHSFKWIVSRARPNAFASEVLKSDSLIPSDVYLPGFMGLHGPRGYSWNSFPSGHVSTCAVFLVFCYLISNTNVVKNRMYQSFAFTSVALYTGLMGIARAMAGMHWISDSVASFFLVWAVVDWTWHKTLSPNIKN